MSALTEAVVLEANPFGHALKTSPTDRRDVPTDFRSLEPLLEVADDQSRWDHFQEECE